MVILSYNESDETGSKPKLCFEGYYYLYATMNSINRALSFILSLPVLVYRYSVSPLLRSSCRHVPTCSQYMLDALKIHGPFTGLLMGAERILRCRPGGTHGYDPVPLFRFRRYKPLATLLSKFESENRLKR
jgi:putative membrane protein insertion efficiency factor